MLTLIFLIWLINLTDYGGPVAIYYPQSKVLPVFIPIKLNHEDDDSKHEPSHLVDNNHALRSKEDEDDIRKENESLSDSYQEINSYDVTRNTSSNGNITNNDTDYEDDKNINSSKFDDENEGQQQTNLLTSSTHQASRVKQMSDSAMKDIIFDSINPAFNDETSNPFEDEDRRDSDASLDPGKSDSLQRLIEDSENKELESSFLTESLASSAHLHSDETLSSLQSSGSIESLGEIGISSPSSSSSSSLTSFSKMVDDDNSFSLGSLVSPFQSTVSDQSSSRLSLPGSTSNYHQHRNHRNHKSLLNQQDMFNLGNSNLDSLRPTGKPLNDLIGAIQRALTKPMSSSQSTSSLTSPAVFIPATSSTTANDYFNLLSLIQQSNENTMPAEKEDPNSHLFKSLFSPSSYTPTLTLSSSKSQVSSPTSHSSASSQSSGKPSQSIESLMSTNGHGTRTIFLPIMSESLTQSANPLYDAFIHSLSTSESSSSSSLPAGSTLKLIEDELNSNSEMNPEHTANSQTNIGEISGLTSVSGTSEMDDSSMMALQGSLVDTSSLSKSHPYVIVDEEFNANGLGLHHGFKPEILGILSPPCIDLSSHGNHGHNKEKPEPEKEKKPTERRPSCPYHHHHHHHHDSQQQNGDQNSSPPKSYPNSSSQESNKNENHANHPSQSQNREPHQSPKNYEQDDRSSKNDDKNIRYHPNHKYNEDNEPMIVPRNRTAFRSTPFIRGAYRYRPDPSYED